MNPSTSRLTFILSARGKLLSGGVTGVDEDLRSLRLLGEQMSELSRMKTVTVRVLCRNAQWVTDPNLPPACVLRGTLPELC